jgi:anti-anti-sigma factor
MSTPLNLESVRGRDGAPVLLVAGEVDFSNNVELAAALEEHLETGADRLTVDLSRVDYLDSAGLSVLFAHAEQIEVIASPLLAPVLEVSGLGQLTAVRVVASPPPRTG